MEIRADRPDEALGPQCRERPCEVGDGFVEVFFETRALCRTSNCLSNIETITLPQDKSERLVNRRPKETAKAAFAYLAWRLKALESLVERYGRFS